MGQFNKLLDATYHPPRKWVLNSSLSYDCDELTEEEIDEMAARFTKALDDTWRSIN